MKPLERVARWISNGISKGQSYFVDELVAEDVGGGAQHDDVGEVVAQAEEPVSDHIAQLFFRLAFVFFLAFRYRFYTKRFKKKWRWFPSFPPNLSPRYCCRPK